jgi:xylono-1,5-lactonase
MTKIATTPARCVAPVAAMLGEGPIWDPRIGRVLFLDIKGEKLFRYGPDDGVVEAFDAPGMVSALGLARSGGYVCAMQDGFALLDIDAGQVKIRRLTDPERETPGNRFNDGKTDPAGGFWAGTMDNSEKSVSGAWWRLSPDGAARRLADGYKVTNGPAFDPARGRVYLTDSARQSVYVAQSDGERLGDRQVFLQFKDGDGYPDGMEVDAEGCLWIAFWDGFAVRRFSPDGALLEEIAIPAPRPTSLAFAGRRLFVTSARTGLNEQALSDYPNAGGLFEIALASSPGRPEPWYFDDANLAAT